MAFEFGFHVCRVCLKPKVLLPESADLISLFDEDRKLSEIFQSASGIDVSLETKFRNNENLKLIQYFSDCSRKGETKSLRLQPMSEASDKCLYAKS